MKPMRIKAPRHVVTTATIQTGPVAIMDDPVYLMDDPRVLMGGSTVPAFSQPMKQPHLKPRVK